MPHLQHFAIPADEPARAIDFYRAVFDWDFEVGWQYETPAGPETYWRIRTGTGQHMAIEGGLTRREFPGQPITVGIEVEDLDGYLGRLSAHGGRVVVPKLPLPSVGWFALCQDSESNTFALIQRERGQESVRVENGRTQPPR